MKYLDLLEGRTNKVIVVDVQPEYTGINDGSELPWIDELMTWLNKQGDILMFANAEDQGMTSDTIQDIKLYWEDSGFSPNKWQQTEIVDKGYGYLRSWMDYQNFHQGTGDDRLIVQTIREMYSQKVISSDQLFDEDAERLEEFIISLGVDGDDVHYYLEDPISVEWTSIGQLKRYSGAYLVGGGRDECLKEVALLMNAFNIRYRMVEDFIYG